MCLNIILINIYFYSKFQIKNGQTIFELHSFFSFKRGSIFFLRRDHIANYGRVSEKIIYIIIVIMVAYNIIRDHNSKLWSRLKIMVAYNIIRDHK